MGGVRTMWARRAALMYTVGTWTIFGFVAYQSYRFLEGKALKTPEEEEQQQPQPQQQQKQMRPKMRVVEEDGHGYSRSMSEDGLTEITTYRTPGKGFYATSTVTYTPDFVPYTTRIYNYVQSFFGNGGGKEKSK